MSIYSTNHQTWIRPWAPGEPWPDDVIILAATMEQALTDLEERARYLWERILRQRVERDQAHADEDWVWYDVNERLITRMRTQLRSVLRARRVVRDHVERQQDRIDAAVKEHWLDGPLWDRQAAGDR